MAVGKWHLGGGPDYRPMERGFGEFYGTLANTPFFHPTQFVDSRVSPDVRQVTDVDGGVTGITPASPALAVASAVWYGCLVYIGAAASRNWEQIMRFFAQFSTALLAVAAVLIVLVAAWWVRSRRDHA